MKYADRVLETTSTQGTGTINLLGPTSGFKAFATSIPSGSKVPYVIDDGTDWEVGIGTITSGDPDTLSRDTVLASTNSDAAVDWGAGTRNVRLAPTADLTVQRDENLNNIDGFGQEGGTANAHTVTLYPVPKAYSDGMIVKWFAPDENTSDVTLNVNSLGAKSYINNDGSEFPSGLIKSGSPQIAIYSEGSDSFVSLVPIVAGTAATKDFATDFAAPSDDELPTTQAVQDLFDTVPFTAEYESAELTITLASAISTITHGLGATPKLVRAYIVCKTADIGYTVGDEVQIGDTFYTSGSAFTSFVQFAVNSTEIKGRVGDQIALMNFSTGARTTITPANWKLIVRAWA